MSNTDKQALRENAESSSAGEWLTNIKASAEIEMVFREAGDTSRQWKDNVTPENIIALAEALEVAERRIAELERDETQLIEERDSAEKALADMYEATMGERPEWSNLFGYAEAIDDVVQHINLLDLAAVTGKGE